MTNEEGRTTPADAYEALYRNEKARTDDYAVKLARALAEIERLESALKDLREEFEKKGPVIWISASSWEALNAQLSAREEEVALLSAHIDDYQAKLLKDALAEISHL